MCIYDDGNIVFRAEKTTICNAKFEDLGDNEDRDQNMWSKVPYLESPTMICLCSV